MEKTVNMDKLHKEIESIKKDIHFIREHMFDPDTIMTTEESGRFEGAMQELKEGKTTSLENVKKDLGL